MLIGGVEAAEATHLLNQRRVVTIQTTRYNKAQLPNNQPAHVSISVMMVNPPDMMIV